MRVLIIVENLPVPLDRRVWQEACTLRDAGHQVSVVCPRMRGYTTAFEVLDGITIYRHWIADEARGIVGFFLEYGSALWGGMICALRAWRRNGFDVVHLCNPPDLLFLIALPFKWLAGVKVVFDVHDLWPEMFEAKFGLRGPLYWAVRIAQRCTFMLADVVLATNQSVRSVAKLQGGMRDDEVFVVRTAPNQLPLFASSAPELRRGRRYLVCYVGVMGNTDGVNYLLGAAQYIVRTLRREDVQFLLMGTGPEFNDLVQTRNEMDLQSHVDMPGRVTDEYLGSALKSMDLGVACDPINSYSDKCTMNKSLEYMVFGKAQVMFGTREGMFSVGDAGEYVMENSAVRLGDAIVDLLDDPERRKRMGVLGQKRLTEELNWERSAEQLLAAYRRVESGL